MMNTVFLEIGGNLGDRKLLITQARSEIEKNVGTVVKASAIYETPPWGFEHEQNFYNQVLCVETLYEPMQVLKKVNSIEDVLGRKRGINQFAPRTMDIDILFFNHHISEKENLVIPHPRLHLRNFVLVPMNEIAPELIHPVFKMPIKTLLNNCIDESECVQVCV